MKWIEEKHSTFPIVLNFIFIMFILFLVSIPLLYGYIPEVGAHIILFITAGVIVISFFISLYWLYLFDLSLKVNGTKEVVYRKLDLIQFRKMSYLNMGYKTRGVFSNGFIADRKISHVLSERYDLFLLVFSVCGTVLLFKGLGNPELSANSIHYNLLRFTAFRSVLSGLGGYMVIWSLSLYTMGLFCTLRNLGEKS